jgi:hypothetical protein
MFKTFRNGNSMLFSIDKPAAQDACCILRQLRVTQTMYEKSAVANERKACNLLNEAHAVLQQLQELQTDNDNAELRNMMQLMLARMHTMESKLETLISVLYCPAGTAADATHVQQASTDMLDSACDTDDPEWDSCSEDIISALTDCAQP